MTAPYPPEYSLSLLPALAGGGIEAPPHLEALVGYDEDRRYVSFHLRLDGRPVIGDGATEKVGHYGPFAAWTTHPYVWPSLSSEESRDDAEPHIVLDRLTRCVYAAAGRDARRFLAESSGARSGERVPRHVPLSELEDDGRGLDPDPMRRMEFERMAAPRMIEWLNARPLPCPSCRAVQVAGDWPMGADGGPVCPACREPLYGPSLFGRLSEIRELRRS